MRATLCSQPINMAPHLLFSEKSPAAMPMAPQDDLKPIPPPSQDDLKRIAGYRAVDHVKPGMVLGLGTGSTAVHALDRIGDLLRRGVLYDIVGIPTSKKTEAHALAVGIPLSDLAAHPDVDLTIDGADEVDLELNLVKGRGGSLLREKMIEGASSRFIVIVDDTKIVPRLGASRGAVPVEVVPFGWSYTLSQINKLFAKEQGFDAKLRTTRGAGGIEEPFVTDNSNYIVDLYFENGITRELSALSDEILRITGVIEHGMFLGMASSVIIAGKDGVTLKNRGEPW